MKAFYFAALAVVLALAVASIGNRLWAQGSDIPGASDRETEEAEGLSESQAELEDLHSQSRERIQDGDDEIAELRSEAPDTPALKALADARVGHLEKLKTLDRQILAVRDIAALDKAWEIWARLSELETEWEMVLEPSLQWAVAIEEMEAQLKEQDNKKRRDVLRQLKLLQAEDGVSRKQEFELSKARRAREKAMESLADKFWEED